MPFFLPSRLVDFEYFGGGEPDDEYEKEAKNYRNDIDFAFFVANFGYSKSEYNELTPRERAFIYKAWENKVISDTTNIYNAVYTATYNVNRPKRKKALKLFKKRSTHKVNEEVVRDNLNVVKQVEKEEGISWIDLIYKKNGLNKPKKRWCNNG